MRTAAVFGLLAAVLLVLGLATPVRAGEGLDPGAQAPDLKLADSEGHELNLADLREVRKDDKVEKEGKVVVITFWSYKCPTGAKYQDRFAELAAWCEKNGAVFVPVDSYGETTEEVQAYAKDHKIGYRIFIDSASDAARALNARKVTASYILDKQGKVAYAGGFDNGAPQGDERLKKFAQAAAEQVLAGKPVETPTTKAKG